MPTLFWKSTCTTCREARSVLKAKNIDFIDRNYSKDPILATEVLQIVAAAGSVAAVLNTRHAIAKEKGWAAQPPDAQSFAAAVVAEPNLLRRPVFLSQQQAIVGNLPDAMLALLTQA
jgi:arsenate reductase